MESRSWSLPSSRCVVPNDRDPGGRARARRRGTRRAGRGEGGDAGARNAREPSVVVAGTCVPEACRAPRAMPSSGFRRRRRVSTPLSATRGRAGAAREGGGAAGHAARFMARARVPRRGGARGARRLARIVGLCRPRGTAQPWRSAPVYGTCGFRDSRWLLKTRRPSAGDDQERALSAGSRGVSRNLEYAHLAREMGASVCASEFFNCSAPDTGNMEVLLRYGTTAQQRDEGSRLCYSGRDPLVFRDDRARGGVVGRDEHRGVHRSDGAEYVLNGKKWWTSGACDPRCALAIFMGKTAPDGIPGVPKHRQQSHGPRARMDDRGRLPWFDRSRCSDTTTRRTGTPRRFSDVRVNASGETCCSARAAGIEIAQGRLGPGATAPLHAIDRDGGEGVAVWRRNGRLAHRRSGSRSPRTGSCLQTLGR